MEMTENVKRRLTTVMCADVKSYTRLMEVDEAGTLETLRRYRDAMSRFVRRHDGRVVNTWGDAIIAEFDSVVEAVQCAIEIQTDLKGRNQTLPADHQMWFRIGINLGDVMVEDGNIYGEGVNIAARLQELADPGGILISRPVHDQVFRRLSVGFDYLGEQAVKNVSDPVISYRVALDGTRARGAPRQTQPGHMSGKAPVAGFPRHWAGFMDWYATLPRTIAFGLTLVAFLFVINLFSGMGTIWFHWPAAPIMFVAFWYFLRSKRGARRRSGDRHDGPGRDH